MPAPALVIFGNPGSEELSERKAWKLVTQEAKAIQNLLMIGKPARAREVADRLVEIAKAMQAQLDRGVHVNPAKKGRTKIAAHVQAIVYVHTQDGKPYVHGFGDAALDERQLQQGVLDFSTLKDRTDVCAYGNPDGTATLEGGHGQPLWKNFPDR